MSLKVFKFGGASVKDADGFKNVGKILKKYKDDKIVVVVSAMGKTTNALEEIVKSYYANDGNTSTLLQQLKAHHFNLVNELFDAGHDVLDDINDTFVEIDWVLEEQPHEDFDYTYDQTVVGWMCVVSYLQTTHIGMPESSGILLKKMPQTRYYQP